MPVTLAFPKTLRQYQLDRLLSEIEAIVDASQPESYTLTFQELGEIPCSLVFRAHHQDLDLDVAVRVIPVIQKDQSSQLGKMLRDVVYRMWEVRDDHIVNLIDYGQVEATHEQEQVPLFFFASEFLKGRQKVTEVLSPSERLEAHINLFDQALRALAYAHERHIVHGRLHPGNLLVEIRNVQLFLRITDFAHHTIDQMSEVPDKYKPYLHPDHIKEGSAKGDLYALASVFYRTLTNQEPLPSTDKMVATLRKRYRATYPQFVKVLEAAWEMESSANDLLRLLNLPTRESVPTFHLTVTHKQGHLYHLHAACPLNGEIDAKMEVSEVVEQIEPARQQIEENQELAEALQEMPQQLYRLLFPPRLAIHLGVAKERARQQRQGLPIVLDFSAAEGLVDWPWELLRDEYTFLGLESQMPLLRALDTPHTDGNRHLTRPLSLLLLSSQPKGIAQLNVKREVSMLKKALGWMGRYHYEYHWLPDASWDRVQDALVEKKPNVVHFIGHGTVNPSDGMGELLFCDEEGNPDPISARELGLLFKDHGIELLFLNACASAQVVEDRIGGAVAISLLRQGIPNVLAMQYPIPDKSATLLTETFYKALSQDKSFADALTAARKALYAKERDKLTWAVPVLYVS